MLKVNEGDGISLGRRRTVGDLIEAKKKSFTEVSNIDKKLKDSLLRLCEIVSPSKHKIGVMRMPPGTCYQDQLYKIGMILLIGLSVHFL